MYKRNAIQQLSALFWILVRKSFVRMYVMAQEGTIDYLAIPKGRGLVYAHANQLYNRVKTEGQTKYLKCSGCDGSAKIVGDMFFLGACTHLFYFRMPYGRWQGCVGWYQIITVKQRKMKICISIL